MEIKYAIITPYNLDNLKMPDGWSKNDFKEFYRHGVRLYSIMAFENGLMSIKDRFMKIFDSIEELNEWSESNLDIITTQYDNVNNKVSILCDNGFVYSTECLTSWTKDDCIHFLNTIKFEDFCIAALPTSKLLRYEEALCINKENVFLEQGFSINGFRFSLFKISNCGLDLSYIINEFNIENNLAITGTFVFESCFEYYNYWKEVIRL